MRRVLITGGAGFIGSHLCDMLLERGDRVRVLDALDSQVHGQAHGEAQRPAHLDPAVELRRGDVRDPLAVREALRGVDAVVHLAAAVGVGQSMYRLVDYIGTNDLGTAVLLEALAERPVERLVVASSMSVYGEGACVDEAGAAAEPVERSLEQLAAGDWEPRDAGGRRLRPVPTSEGKRPALSSIYALSKYTQERACLMIGRARGIPTVALRLYNVFGPRQALSNPYTGVVAIFASRLLNGRRPLVFEDGRQQRDLVHVRDVARAFTAALDDPRAAGHAINVGSGSPRTIAEVAASLARAVGRDDLAPETTGRYRAGDIRHCFADTTTARALLGHEAIEDFDAGLVELATWLEGEIAVDRVDAATEELVSRGLVA